MICKNCGNEISENSAFCSGCGKPVEAETQQAATPATQKESIINTEALKNQVKTTMDKASVDKAKIKKLAPVAIGALAILFLVAAIIINATSKVSVKKFIAEDVPYTGINGYGTVEVEDVLDFDGLHSALIAGSVTEEDLENEEFWEYALYHTVDYIEYEWSENNGTLSNGDTVTLTLTIDKEGIKNNPLYKKKISGGEEQSFKFKVEGLEDGVVIDVFDAVECCYYDETKDNDEYILKIKDDYTREYEKGITVVCEESDSLTVYGDDFYSFTVPVRLASDKVSDKAASTKVVLGCEQTEYVDLGIVFKETEKAIAVKHLSYVKSNIFDKETLKILQDRAIEAAKEKIDTTKYSLYKAELYVGGGLDNQVLAYFFKGSDGFYVVNYEDMKYTSDNKLYDINNLEPEVISSWLWGAYKFDDMTHFLEQIDGISAAKKTDIELLK